MTYKSLKLLYAPELQSHIFLIPGKTEKEIQHYTRCITTLYQYYWITMTRKRHITSSFLSCFILLIQLNHRPMNNKQDDHIFITLPKIYSRGHEGVTFRNINSSEGHNEKESAQPFWIIGPTRHHNQLAKFTESTISRADDRSLFPFVIFSGQFIPCTLLQSCSNA